MENDFNDLSDMVAIGKYTTTLDMLMHHHPWLAKLLQWQPIETRPTKEGSEFLIRDKFQTWLVQVGFSGNLNPKDNGCGCCSSAIYDATHWMAVPAAPGTVGWENAVGLASSEKPS